MAKGYNDAIADAFAAGARFGARYPEPDSWPASELELQIRAYQDHKAGHTWSPAIWEQERQEAGLNEGPHSRACGVRKHDHGPECHSNCPTCGGRRG